MAENLFTKITQGRPVALTTAGIQAARDWFREAALKVGKVGLRHLLEQNQKDLVASINITSIGSMFTFSYDPKWKEKLPYYDMHPLIFVVEVYGDGFLGINLHYLPPYYRATLMDALYTTALKGEKGQTKNEKGPKQEMMKLQISYQVLKSASRFRMFKPCLKRYLSAHVTSRYLFVEPGRWDIALQLPTQRFVKASEEQIWKESRSKM